MTDRIDSIVRELSELNGTFKQFSKDITKKVDKLEEGQEELLKSIGAVHIRCSEHLSKIEVNRGEIAETRAVIKEHLNEHKQGATTREKYAIAGSYVLQLAVKFFDYLTKA